MFMSRLITMFVISAAGTAVGLATKNFIAALATTLVLVSLDCILQDAVRRFKA